MKDRRRLRGLRLIVGRCHILVGASRSSVQRCARKLQKGKIPGKSTHTTAIYPCNERTSHTRYRRKLTTCSAIQINEVVWKTRRSFSLRTTTDSPSKVGCRMIMHLDLPDPSSLIPRHPFPAQPSPAHSANPDPARPNPLLHPAPSFPNSHCPTHSNPTICILRGHSPTHKYHHHLCSVRGSTPPHKTTTTTRVACANGVASICCQRLLAPKKTMGPAPPPPTPNCSVYQPR